MLAGTPLGRISDASDGLRAALAGADVIAAEDTRRLHRLLADLGVGHRLRHRQVEDVLLQGGSIEPPRCDPAPRAAAANATTASAGPVIVRW